MRYQDTCKKQETKECQNHDLKDQKATPDAYMHALKEGLSVTCERFASPLNFNPLWETYYSNFEEDRIFGANINAFSTQWVGASQANPSHQPESVEKAVQWAILSAEQTTMACLTASMLPKDILTL